MLTPEYIVGLIDGEGSFTAYVRNIDESTDRIRRAHVEPRFYVKLIERDKVILDALKEYFQCGNVYFQKDTRQNHQNCYRYEVANRTHLSMVIIPFFKKHALRFPSRKKDFDLFCTIMKCVERGEHLTKAGMRKLYTLKQKMH